MTSGLVGRVTRSTRWVLGVLMVVVLGGAGGWGLIGRGSSAPVPASVAASVAPPSGLSSALPRPAVAITPIDYPVRGTGRFFIAPDSGPVVGTRGRLLRYRIAVEAGITGITASQFADSVSQILGDPRSWIGTRHWRLQLVPAGAHYDFTIYLATPATRDVLCKCTYDLYTSCRRDNNVLLNVARWVHGVPEYDGDLTTYRQYMVNHEVGHRLYNGHELCPGPGQLAPVMQQQTLGLHGCLPNSWPMVDGRPYHGRSGQYDDPVPLA